MKLKEALTRMQPGQFVKLSGDSFNGNTGYYVKDEKGVISMSVGGAAGYMVLDIEKECSGMTANWDTWQIYNYCI